MGQTLLRSRRWRRMLIVVVGVGILVGGTGWGAMLWHIRTSVNKSVELAQQAHPHPGDDVSALLAYALSEDHELSRRNGAIWALGRLGDTAALAGLVSVYTGEPCRHAEEICQYELAKAIRRCGAASTPLPPH